MLECKRALGAPGLLLAGLLFTQQRATYIETYTYRHVHRHIHIQTYRHIHTFVRIHTDTYIHTYKHIHIHMHIYTRTHTDTYTYTMHIYAHVHTNPYTHVYTQTHTCLAWSFWQELNRAMIENAKSTKHNQSPKTKWFQFPPVLCLKIAAAGRKGSPCWLTLSCSVLPQCADKPTTSLRTSVQGHLIRGFLCCEPQGKGRNSFFMKYYHSLRLLIHHAIIP